MTVTPEHQEHPARRPLVLSAMRAALTLLAVGVSTANEHSVDIYAGPVDCDESDKLANGDYVQINYKAWIDESSEKGDMGELVDASNSDTSVDGSRLPPSDGKPYEFQLGKRKVIKGLDVALEGLCVGAKATMVFPPAMACKLRA